MLCGDQRSIDMHWNHLCFLMDKLNNEDDSAEATRPAAEWLALAAAPAGYDTRNILRHLGASTHLTHSQFSKSVSECMSMLAISSSPYTPCADLVRTCSSCKVPCTSECMCGESFCSRKCMRKEWANHREICKMIYANNEMDWTLTQFEMKHRLTSDQMDEACSGSKSVASSIATGGTEDLLKAGAAACAKCNRADKKMKLCSKCRMMTYCSAECQKADWKKHKPNCAIIAQVLGM